jgi:hypothetical protein
MLQYYGAILINNSVEKFINTAHLSKIFTISHYCLQYFFFCSKILDGTVQSLEEKSKVLQLQVSKCKRMVVDRDAKIQNLEQKLKRCISVLFPCSKCSKVYDSQAHLDGHIARRHSNIKNDENLLNSIKFEIEIRQLKERLAAKEVELNNFRKITQHVEVQTERQDLGPEVATLISQEVNANVRDLFNKISDTSEISSIIERKFDEEKNHNQEDRLKMQKLVEKIHGNQENILKEISVELEETFKKSHAEMSRNFQEMSSLFAQKLIDTEERLMKHVKPCVNSSATTQTEEPASSKTIKKSFSGQKFLISFMKPSKNSKSKESEEKD